MSSVFIFWQVESDNSAGRRGGVGRAARDRAAGPARPSASARSGAAAHEELSTRSASLALGYLALLLRRPVALVFYSAFEHGLAAAWDAVTTPEAQHAFWLTIVMVAIAVPLNTVFGVIGALLLVRQRFRGRALLNAAIDLPFAVSPVVVGLALLLVYGSRDGWFGDWLAEHGIQMIFSVPGMVLATMFVSLPFVVREAIPVLREIGTDQEQAAATLGAGPLADLLAR